ncbi:peroxiredoxin-like family protein [Phycisphaerales bacterium AB-hyl4]|uniref:thioredoxin-dependent peroxiredoxin n=1 Tax=Natronomicrosphaera hydrolytica TaxID=3242702 RepID=A0ABV4UAD6_9BACT
MALVIMALMTMAACENGAERVAVNDSPPVPERAEDVQPLTEGQPAPVAVLRTADDDLVDLAEQYRQQPTMLIFYRGGWCPYCNVQLGHLMEAEQAIEEMGIAVLAISPDRPAVLRENPNEAGHGYRLLSDSDMALAKAFGVAFRVADETVEQYHGFGIDLEDASGQSHHLLPVPAIYLVDRDGMIRFAHWDADYRERLSPEALIEAAGRMSN